MEQSKELMKVEYPTGDYHKVWNDVEPEQYLSGVYAYGTRSFSKMIEFLKQTYFDKEAFRYYITLTPARQENEEFEDYKVRRKFQKVLLKYKHQTRQAIFINTVERLQAKAKEDNQTKEKQTN